MIQNELFACLQDEEESDDEEKEVTPAEMAGMRIKHSAEELVRKKIQEDSIGDLKTPLHLIPCLCTILASCICVTGHCSAAAETLTAPTGCAAASDTRKMLLHVAAGGGRDGHFDAG